MAEQNLKKTQQVKLSQKTQSKGIDYDFLEQKVLTEWNRANTFEQSLEQNKTHTPYVFYDGPPFATGMPHVGHILGSTVKDLFGRYQTMRGKYVRRRWGWDCHGLPIENIVEKELNISGRKQILDLGVDRFNETCRSFVLKYAGIWGDVVNRIGRWVDFSNSYKTMDTSYMESVWWALQQFWKKDLIYQDRRVLLYCGRCETPLSNFEVSMDNSYREITDTTLFVKFKLHSGQRILDHIIKENTYVLAWTTTPWTLPANVALAVGTEITYVLLAQNGSEYILAKDRLEVIQGAYEVVQEFSSRSLEGLRYEPLFASVATETETAFQIYAEDFVTTEDGSGVVHIAPMYGEEDYQMLKRHGLPVLDVLNQQGHFTEHAPEFLQGKFFVSSNKLVIAELGDRVYAAVPHAHSYPHCYRCDTRLYYNALTAWFINVQKLKPSLLTANEAINWYPAHLKQGRFKNNLETAPDWNITRNRYWATALPFWVCENEACKNIDCIGSIAELQAGSPNFSEIYPDYDPENLKSIDLHKPNIDRVLFTCTQCQAMSKRIPEVIDCWFESASMPFAELHYPFENQTLFKERYPADFVSEYIAQTRAWFYVMHVVGTGLFGSAPFKNVVTTGTILAADGSKMSKSKKNFTDPTDLIQKFGVDALRFYLLTSSVMQSEDVQFKDEYLIEVTRKLNTILYNVLVLYQTYKTDILDSLEAPQPTHILDEWIIARLKQTTHTVTAQLDRYNTITAGRAIQEFVTDLSTWYVRGSRNRIKSAEHGPATLAVLGYVLAETAKLLAPFMPFLSDFIYRNITGAQSVHLANWSSVAAIDDADSRSITDMEIVLEAASMGHALRKQLAVPVRQPLQSMELVLGDGVVLSQQHTTLLLQELNVLSIESGLVDLHTIKPEYIHVLSGSAAVKRVVLNTEMSPALEAAGWVREFERVLQDLRKQSGLKVGQQVSVYIGGGKSEVRQAILQGLDREKTFVSEISENTPETEVDNESQGQVGGQPMWIGIIQNIEAQYTQSA